MKHLLLCCVCVFALPFCAVAQVKLDKALYDDLIAKEAKVKELEKECAILRKKTEALQKDIEKESKKPHINKLIEECNKLEADIAQKLQSKAQVEANNTVLQKSIDSLRIVLQKLLPEVEGLEKEYAKVQELKKEEEELKKQKETLDEQKIDALLPATIVKIEQRKKELQNEKTVLEQKQKALEQELVGLRKAQSEVNDLRAKRKELEDKLKNEVEIGKSQEKTLQELNATKAIKEEKERELKKLNNILTEINQ